MLIKHFASVSSTINKGFIKTALKNYTMDSLNKEVHLTNLAEARLHEEYQ